MSKDSIVSKARKSASKALRPEITPMIGALLRLPHEAVMARMLAALAAGGFDLTLIELGAFLYPGPDGRRAVDLARQCNTTRQAMNYILASLEERGYIERRAESDSTRPVIRLTKRGWRVVVVVRNCVSDIEKEWAEHLGARRFAALRDTLYDLALRVGKLEPKSADE